MVESLGSQDEKDVLMRYVSRRSRSPLWAAPAALALMLVAATFLGGCGNSSSSATSATSATSAPAGVATTAAQTATTAGAAVEVQDVDLMMDWIPWVLDIPFDVAQAKGFYGQEGLNVHMTVPVEATDVVKFVSTGKSQFGLYYSPDMLMAVDAGAPLISVGSLMSHAPVGMALKPGLTADSPSALKDKVASVPLIPSTRASFSSMLAAAGVDAASVKVVDPGFELVAPLLKGTVDAAAFTQFGELVEAEAQGQKLTYLDFRDWGTPDYAFLNVITTQEFAGSNPKTTRAFLRATYSGLAYAVANPEEAVTLYVKAHPELDETLLLAQWKAAIPSLAVAANGHPAGWQDVDAWGSLNVWMKNAGLLKSAVDLVPAVKNDYLEAAS
jgi:ABC-type nitrate/sulfonate/bicarbonate transport system substrate-binding protein